MQHIEYFYTPPENISSHEVILTGAEFKHLATVMRKKTGDIIQVVDGVGNQFTSQISKIDKRQAICSIEKKSRLQNEPNFHLTLAAGIPKSSRFDWIIEKGTELGVSTFIPLIAERSVNKGSESKQTRWRKVAIAAMKQSTRCILPDIEQVQPVQKVCAQAGQYDVCLIAHPGHVAVNLIQLLHKLKARSTSYHTIKKGIILIGPEGGFTPVEIQQAMDNKFQQVTLGGRRLRTETAAILASGITVQLMDYC